MPQKKEEDDRHEDRPIAQNVHQVVDRGLDEHGLSEEVAIQHHASSGQLRLELVERFVDQRRGREGVRGGLFDHAQDDRGASVVAPRTAPHRRSNAYLCDIAHAHRNALASRHPNRADLFRRARPPEDTHDGLLPRLNEIATRGVRAARFVACIVNAAGLGAVHRRGVGEVVHRM